MKRPEILKIRRLLSQIDEYELDTPAGFHELTIQYIADNYNGAGPDWMPDNMRHVITWLLSCFEPAFLIHDMEFSASNRTAKGFIAANSRMWRNIRKIINYEYPLFNPLCWISRAKWYVRGCVTYEACKRFGWSAWTD
ncbi:MAG: hypothetical protein WCV67_10920 [Victivallaceae bacterium]|jgi:hypothetical protein